MFYSQSIHRTATAAFWRTFHRDGKISPGWWGSVRVHAHPLSLCLPSQTKLQCTLPLSGQIRSLYFFSTPMYSVVLLVSTLPGNSHTFSRQCQVNFIRFSTYELMPLRSVPYLLLYSIINILVKVLYFFLCRLSTRKEIDSQIVKQ